MLLNTRGGVLSTEAVRMVRLVRSGGPGFVPFLFPGFMSASEATDVRRMTDASGNHLRAGLTVSASVGNSLNCDVLVSLACGSVRGYISLARISAAASPTSGDHDVRGRRDVQATVGGHQRQASGHGQLDVQRVDQPQLGAPRPRAK